MRSLSVLLLLCLAFAPAAIPQTAAVDLSLGVSDGAGSSVTLRFGLDPSATDGVDPGLTEKEQPPMPPVGAFAARFTGPGLGQGVLKDYRQGTTNTSGTRVHELSYQVGSGSSITISWNLPSGVTGRLQDLITGALIDVEMEDAGQYMVANPSGFSKLKMTVTYALVSSAPVIVNGGFESGTTPWKYYHNGTGNSFGVVSTTPVPEGANKARVVLGSSIGTNNQLYQSGLTLAAGTGYRITFAHHASGNTTFRVRVIEQDDDYTVYGFAFKTISTTTGVQTYTLDFTTANFTGTVTDAMLQIYFVGGTASRTIYIDDIIIGVQGSTPPPVPSKLSFGTQPSSTQAGSTITPAVTVRIEDAGGSLMTTDTRNVTIAIGANPAGGSLSGTTTVAAVGGVATFSNLSINNAGTGYTLAASASGLTGATSSPFNVTAIPPPPTGNILVNGGFESGTAPWKYYQNGTGNSFGVVSTAPVPEGANKARVVLGSSIGTNNQLYQSGLTLAAGTAYRITFAHHASGNTTFRVRVIEQDDDYTVYGFAFKTISTTTGVQTYTLDFTTANFTGTVTDAMLQFYFVGGTASRTIYIDNIVIAEAPASPATTGILPVSMPSDSRLHQNYPNPFNPSTRISFSLTAPADVTLSVYNVAGELIRVLADGAMGEGIHEVSFDASNLPSGLYFYRLESRDFMEVKRMLLMK